MKIILVPIAFMLFSCGAKKNDAIQALKTPHLESPCANDGNCSFEIIPQKSIEIKTDGFGKIYYELADHPEKIVYRYNYSDKVEDSTLQDAGYREEIIFEADSKTAAFSYEGKNIQLTKMIFGVFCFCRGKAGYYKVNDGKVMKNGNEVVVQIPEIVSAQRTHEFSIK